jgi:hypothetical protein
MSKFIEITVIWLIIIYEIQVISQDAWSSFELF